MAKNKKVSKQQITNEEGMPILGWLVNSSTREFKIGREDLVDMLDKVGIDSTIAREVIPKNAAVRAMRELGKGGSKFHRKIADQEAVAAFVVAKTEVDDKLDADFSTELKGLFDKKTRKFEAIGSQKKEAEEAFERNKRVYSGDQFRAIVLRYLKRSCAAITYLETGNIYFVPANRHEEFKRLQDLFDLLKPFGAKLSVKEEVNTKQIRKTMWDITIGEVSHQIANMKKDLANMPKDAKESTLQNRLGKYKDLRTKVDMYATALQGRAEKMVAELNDLTKAVTKSLDAISE